MLCVGVVGQRRSGAEPVEQQAVVRGAGQSELRVRVVKPVGRRDANLDALGIGNAECLEHRQIAAEVMRVADIGPDRLTVLSERRCCRRQRCCKAVGVEVLILQQSLARIADEYRAAARSRIGSFEPKQVAGADGVRLVAADHGGLAVGVYSGRRNRHGDRRCELRPSSRGTAGSSCSCSANWTGRAIRLRYVV